ncbi:MAG: Bax inhibitor-1/YccA family protein [Acidobacteria bacterium]|nr:Bax inhibitor-1/YccA family protein [Acidobacteriota bacterium]
MAFFRSSNPTLNDKTFQNIPLAIDRTNVMTIDGTVNRTGFLLFLVVAAAGWTWRIFYSNPQDPTAVMPWMLGGAIGGFVLALVTIFKNEWAPFTAPVYAVLEGLLLGGLSAFFELRFHGIVIQAVGLTFGTMAALLLAYKSGIIRATENFKLGVVAATGGIALLYFSTMILGFFGIQIPQIYESGAIGIGFSAFVVVIAALNLVLDFDFIEQGAAKGAPKYMEWYGGFALLVTLIWLYMEILRLLSKLRDRR